MRTVRVTLDFWVDDAVNPEHLAELIGEMFADGLESVPVALPSMYESIDGWDAATDWEAS